jgi:two-component system response regulator
MRNQVRRVLIAEDNPHDVTPLFQAFKKRPAWEIAVVDDGMEALDYLFKHEKYTDVWRPDLFILSLQMPLLHGYEVLEQIKDIPYLASIPVVIWTASQREEDIARAYERGAAAFISKPAGDDEMKRCAIAIRTFWDSVQFLYND